MKGKQGRLAENNLPILGSRIVLSMGYQTENST